MNTWSVYGWTVTTTIELAQPSPHITTWWWWRVETISDPPSYPRPCTQHRVVNCGHHAVHCVPAPRLLWSLLEQFSVVWILGFLNQFSPLTLLPFFLLFHPFDIFVSLSFVGRYYWVGLKVHLGKFLAKFFPHDGSSRPWLSSTSFRTVLLDCVVTAVISACTFLKPIKIGEFLCSHFNFEDGRKYATEMQKKRKGLCNIRRSCWDWSNVLKVIVKFLGTIDILAK